MREMKRLEKYFSQKPGFWFFQTLGWIFMIITDVIQMYDKLQTTTQVFIWILSLSVCFSLTLILRKLYRHFYNQKRSAYFHFLVLIPIATLLFTFIWILLKDLGSIFIQGGSFGCIPDMLSQNYTLHNFTLRVLNFSWVLLAWSFLYFAIKFWMDLLETKANYEKASLLAQKSQLQMLRYQLNPHFLFNCLNSIQALIYSNPERADKMISELADFLRYTLNDGDKLYLKLQDEIQNTEKYLSIEKTRFPERLRYNINVSEEAARVEVIAFLLQPFVENAIKHGFKSYNEILIINIDCTCLNGTLSIKIENTGKWVEKKESTGTGIKNVFNRLNNAYPGKHSVSIDKGENFVRINIDIFL